MPWESRRNGQYYYRKRKEAGRVVSEYVGSGVYANLAELQDDVDRIQRSQKRKEMAEFKRVQRRIDEAINDYGTHVSQVVARVLRRLGYHQHKRQWRLKRKAESVGNNLQQNQVSVEEIAEYRRLFHAAKDKGAKSAEILQLRAYALEHPAVYTTLLNTAGEMLSNAIDAAASTPAVVEHMHGEVQAMKLSLGMASANAVEKMLIETVVLAWVRLQTMEAIYTKKFSTGDGVSLTYAAYLEDRLNATHRRYLRAVETLARVRALLARAGVQVNVAQQMVVQNG